MSMTAEERMAFMEDLIPQFEQYIAERERVKQETQPKAGVADYVTAGAGVALPLVSRLFGKGSAGRDITRGLGSFAGGAFRGMQEGKRGIQESALAGVDRQQTNLLGQFKMAGELGRMGQANRGLDLQERGVALREADALEPETMSPYQAGMLEVAQGREARLGSAGGADVPRLTAKQKIDFGLEGLEVEKKSLVAEANQAFQELSPDIQAKAGLKGNQISSIGDIERVAQVAIRGESNWFSADIPADSSFYRIVQKYNELLQRESQMLSPFSGQGISDMTDEELQRIVGGQ